MYLGPRHLSVKDNSALRFQVLICLPQLVGLETWNFDRGIESCSKNILGKHHLKLFNEQFVILTSYSIAQLPTLQGVVSRPSSSSLLSASGWGIQIMKDTDTQSY